MHARGIPRPSEETPCEPQKTSPMVSNISVLILSDFLTKVVIKFQMIVLVVLFRKRARHM